MKVDLAIWDSRQMKKFRFSIYSKYADFVIDGKLRLAKVMVLQRKDDRKMTQHEIDRKNLIKILTIRGKEFFWNEKMDSFIEDFIKSLPWEKVIVLSFGRNPNSAPDDVQRCLSKSDINRYDCLGKDVVFTHYGELATRARLDELQPRSTPRGNCNKENNNAHDAVNHPSHYCRDGIECIDVIKATTKGMNAFDAFCQGNAIKYLFRWQYKNGVEDLKKARWYIDKLIEIQESSANKKKE